MSGVSETGGPVRARERIATLDVIRGVALFGILIMNMPDYGSSFFSGSTATVVYGTRWDSAAQILQDVLFSQKFNTMFGLLFGIGFTIQFGRLMQRDAQSAINIYFRRLVALFVIGLVHACLLWTGDVLHLYAMLGFILLAARAVRDRTLLAAAILLVLASAATGTFGALVSTPADEQVAHAAAQEWAASNDLAYGRGTFFDAAVEHTRELIFDYTAASADTSGLVSFSAQMAAAMLLGILIGRRRWIQDAALYPAQLRIAHWTAAWLAVAFGAVYMLAIRVVELDGPSLSRVLVSFTNTGFRLSLTAFYVLSIVRVMQVAIWRSRLAPLAFVGRMPLTNYVLQTVVATFIFYGWGLGLWGKLGPALLMALAILIYAVQVPLSVWWLRRTEYGPLELTWRWMTYGRTHMGTRQIPERGAA